jgi:ADP-ribose pyrophosphatase
MNVQLLNREHRYSGRIISVREDSLLLPNGRKIKHEIVDHGKAVVILPFDGNHIHFVQQYRGPAETFLTEVPAGKMDEGENPLDAAKRELKEETGFTAKTWIQVGEAYPAPGFCTEYLYFFLATDLEKGETHPDEDEYLIQVSKTVNDAMKMIQNKEIVDAKTLLSIFYLNHYLEGKKS